MPEHPKVLEAGPMSAWLYICGLAYADRNETDGKVPATFVSSSCSIRGAKGHAKRLVEVGLWREAAGGYEIHDYLAHQRSRAEKEAQRAGTAERVKRHRNARRTGVTPPLVTPVREEKNRGTTSSSSEVAVAQPREEEAGTFEGGARR